MYVLCAKNLRGKLSYTCLGNVGEINPRDFFNGSLTLSYLCWFSRRLIFSRLHLRAGNDGVDKTAA